MSGATVRPVSPQAWTATLPVAEVRPPECDAPPLASVAGAHMINVPAEPNPCESPRDDVSRAHCPAQHRTTSPPQGAEPHMDFTGALQQAQFELHRLQEALASGHARVLGALAHSLKQSSDPHVLAQRTLSPQAPAATTLRLSTRSPDSTNTRLSVASMASTLPKPTGMTLALPWAPSEAAHGCHLTGSFGSAPSHLGVAGKDGAGKARSFGLLPCWAQTPSTQLPSPQRKRGTEAVGKLGGNRATARHLAPQLDDALHVRAWDDSGGSTLHGASIKSMHCCKDSRMAPIHPNSALRISWDLLSFLSVLHDLCYIPLLAFDPEETDDTVIIEWFIRIFWTVDVGWSFTSGFVTADGDTQMRWNVVVKRYVRSWFPLDFIIIANDWSEIFFNAGSGVNVARASKSSRIFRLLRLLRLLRVARLRETLNLYVDRFNSEALATVASALNNIIIIMGLAHYIACGWYAIGARQDVGDTWVKDHDLVGASLLLRYTMALHWSQSQFTGGMDEIRPKNVDERLYTISVFLVAFILASCFVSLVTSTMTQMVLVVHQRAQQVSALRRFLAQNKISRHLCFRINRNAMKQALDHQLLTTEVDVELLEKVSDPLREELHFELFTPTLSVHPFFHDFFEDCPQVARRICHHAVLVEIVATGDTLFSCAEFPHQPRMYFVQYGEFSYQSMQGLIEIVGPGDWLAEGSLWTTWMHHGEFRAMTEARLVLVDAKCFQTAIGEFEALEYDPREYARKFVAALNRLSDVELTDLKVDESVKATNPPRASRQVEKEVPSVARQTLVALKSFFAGRPPT